MTEGERGISGEKARGRQEGGGLELTGGRMCEEVCVCASEGARLRV